MSESQRPRNSLWTVLGYIGIGMVLYVLSVGPVAAILSRFNSMPYPPVIGFYWPLIWLHENTPLKVPLDGYLALWGV